MDSAMGSKPGEDLDPKSEVFGPEMEEKRPVENGEEGELTVRGAKKPRVGEDMKRVAEIVLVLSAMGQMRGGKSPTKVEMGLMAEARAKLADMCQEFSPKDIVGRDAVGAVIEDLGLNGKLKDQRLGFRAPKLTISEKLSIAKKKMEESKKYMAPQTSFPPQGSTTHTARTLSSDKAGFATQSTGGFMAPSTSNLVTSVSNATSSNQFTGNGIKGSMVSASMGMGSGHYARDPSTLSSARVDRPHIRSEGASLPVGVSQSRGYSSSHTVLNRQTWSGQPQAGMLTRTAADNKASYQGSCNASQLGQAGRDQSFRSHIIQTAPGGIQSANQTVQGLTFAGTSFFNNHAEIAKIVEKFLQPRVVQQPTWTPPSREYMNKVLACQMCRVTINEVDTVLVCDACEKGFHLKCLQSNNLKSIPKFEWHCPRCLQLSHGKPLPPKYGRVMRSVSTTKVAPNTSGAQLPAEKKVGNPDPKGNPQKTDPKPNTGSHDPGLNSSTGGGNFTPASNTEGNNFKGTAQDSGAMKRVVDQTSDYCMANQTKPVEVDSSYVSASYEESSHQQANVVEQSPELAKSVSQSEVSKSQLSTSLLNPNSDSYHPEPSNGSVNNETMPPDGAEALDNDGASTKPVANSWLRKDENNQQNEVWSNAVGSPGTNTRPKTGGISGPES